MFAWSGVLSTTSLPRLPKERNQEGCTSDNKGFKKLVELLDKDITIPGRRAITELIDKKFVDMMSMSKKLQKRLAKAR